MTGYYHFFKLQQVNYIILLLLIVLIWLIFQQF
nr:MAG TPA: hypothetical protein [Caudoviricetes sp.]